jgi:hypothetical protein
VALPAIGATKSIHTNFLCQESHSIQGSVGGGGLMIFLKEAKHLEPWLCEVR